MRPRVILAAILAALLQTGAIAGIIANRAIHIATGREIVLDAVLPEFIPIDQLLLGRNYVHLDYSISKIDGSIVRFSRRLNFRTPFFVTLERQGQAGGGKWVAIAASTERPAAPETDDRIVLRGALQDCTNCSPEARDEYGDGDITLRYGIESYFPPKSAERDLAELVRQGAVKIAAAVDRNGKAAIKAIIVEGVRHEEPLL